MSLFTSNMRMWLSLAAVSVAVTATTPAKAQLPDAAPRIPTVANPAPTVSPTVDNPLGIPDLTGALPTIRDEKGVTGTMSILVLVTVLTLAPTILVLMTSFTRIVIVLSMLRQALGTQQLPPSQVIIGLSLVLTMLVMAPTYGEIHEKALNPYMNGELSQQTAFERAGVPLRRFMIRQIEQAQDEEDVYMFVEYARGEPIPASEGLRWEDVRLRELVPAFVLSELKTSFIMGFRIYLPFLVIDMVISAILISMGMLMLPPVLISLPFKLLLFVIADGWALVVGSLLSSFG